MMLTAFSRGIRAHIWGLRFARARKGYLAAALVPFLLTLALYAVGFWLLSSLGDQLLGLFWAPAGDSHGVVGVLAWLYFHVAKYLLYLLATVLMYFLFMVVANILASPLYDRIAENLAREAADDGAAPGKSLPFWRTMIEECKKAVFVALVPVLLVFVPVVGQILAPLMAAILLAYDFLDFSVGRDEPRFAERLRFITRHPMALLGFGVPLLVPILNIILFPFAILGATLLYLTLTGRSLPASPQK